MQTVLKTKEPDLRTQLQTIRPLIGNTPLVEIKEVFQKKGVRIFAKLEWQQLSGSIKARAAFEIIEAAIFSGALSKDKILLDATSGNTGIAYASICSILEIPVHICIPENASEERKSILSSLGAKLIFTSPFELTEGSQKVARELFETHPGRYFYADQYSNENNWRAHYRFTAGELFDQTQGQITHFVAGLGTTGTFTGTGRRLKELNPEIQLVALQPETAMHLMEGWKHLPTAGAPAIFDPSIPDATVEVASEDALALISEVREKEALSISPSSAANLAGAIKVAQSIEEGTVVTVFPDNSERYSEVLKTIR